MSRNRGVLYSASFDTDTITAIHIENYINKEPQLVDIISD